VTAPTLRRDLSPLTSATLEAGNVVIRELDTSGPTTVVRIVTLATFLADVERLEAAIEAEVLCGATRHEDDAYCAELVGHEDTGLDHLWVGGVHSLCIADPVPPDGPSSERKDSGR
jgi:hypothetical protein